MFPLTSILCPVDFSEASREALRWAIGLAGRDGATLRVLSVVEPAVTEAGVIAFDPGELERGARESLIEFVRQTAPAGASWWREPAIAVRAGVPWVEIVDHAEELSTDLVVMGTHGFAGVRKAFFGSTTERVLRRTRTPVLAVPPEAPASVQLAHEAPIFLFGRVVAPVDFSAGTAMQADTAARTAKTFGVPLIVLHVVPDVREHALLTPHRDTRDRLRRAQAAHQIEALTERLSPAVSTEAVVRAGDPAEEIALLVAERQAGLVVMGLRGHGGLFGARPGSIAYRVMCQSRVPVLALPPHVRARAAELVSSRAVSAALT